MSSTPPHRTLLISVAQVHWTLPDSACVYIVDCHRPFRHSNVRNASQRVVVLDFAEPDDGGDGIPREGDSDFGGAFGVFLL